MDTSPRPNRYFYTPPRKGKKRQSLDSYKDWKTWNLARDGARTHGTDSHASRRKTTTGSRGTQAGGITKKREPEPRRISMADVEAKLWAKSSEYAVPPVKSKPTEAEEVEETEMEEAEEAEEEEEEEEEEEADDEEADDEEEEEIDDEDESLSEEVEEEEAEAEDQDDEIFIDDASEVTQQLQRESEMSRALEDSESEGGTVILEDPADQIEFLEEGEEQIKEKEGRRSIEVEVEELPPPPLEEDSDVLDLSNNYDYSVDYRGKFEPPPDDYQELHFPKKRAVTEVEKQREVVEDWQTLWEKRRNLEPYDEKLVTHTVNRLTAHRAELDQLIKEEPLLPKYKDTRIQELQECLKTYENADEIVNVKAAIKAFEDGVLGNHLDQWTVFYNGRIVDRINSHRELLWSVRQPLYQEIYGKIGSIWIEPPTNDTGKACVTLSNELLVSGAHWYIVQNVCLPWCDEVYAKDMDFLLDTGASDPMMSRNDLLDLGLVKKNCPHIANRKIATAVGKVNHDFYPLFIQHKSSKDKKGKELPLYPMMDTIVGVLTSKKGDRLSGLDLFRFCYVGSEPSTGRLSYNTTKENVFQKIRKGIVPGGTLTPRAWFTRAWDSRAQKFTTAKVMCSLVGRPPRLLNSAGERWVHDVKEYPYQYGRSDRSPHQHITYIPGHRVHPPTPDNIRDDRKYYWSKGWPYRDNRPYVGSYKDEDGCGYERDEYYGFHKRGRTPETARPLNPWQYKSPEERFRQPKMKHVKHPPVNPLGVMYWDDRFPAVVKRRGIDPSILPNFDPTSKKGPFKFRTENSYFPMRKAYGANTAAVGAAGQASKGPGVKRPKYIDEDIVIEDRRSSGQGTKK